jgi:hypothetical protein
MKVQVIGDPWINEDGHETWKMGEWIGMQCEACGHRSRTTRKDMFDIGDDPDFTWWL